MWPRRAVHLDFHTGPAIPDVGRDFDAEAFARTMVEAHVQSVTVFAKCHHGQTYYDTDRPERHPHLKPGLDLLGEQVEALHRHGLLAPVYLSVQVDEHAADQHPEWLALDPDGRQVKFASGRFEAGWQVLDMDSPYADYLGDQLDDVLDHLGRVDGVFLDMCWDQPSASNWAIDAMRQKGLDPAAPADRARHAREVAHGYMSRYRKQIAGRLTPDAPMSVWFNSRPKTALADEVSFVDHVEIEALATGGWGYSYFPYVARFVAPLGRPTMAHTGRFHKSWGDNGGLKPVAALTYECAQMLALGVSATVGDLLPPVGVLQPDVYRLIGEVFARLEALEPELEGTRPAFEAAVLMDPALGDAPGPVGVGLVRLLQQVRVQFCVLPPTSDLVGLGLVVVPECTVIDPALRARLDAHMASGGALLLVGAAAVDECGLAVVAGQGVLGSEVSPYSHTFLHDERGGFSHVMYEPTIRLIPEASAQVPFAWHDPFFERTWDHFSGHEYTPVRGDSGFAAVVIQSRVATIGAPLFTAYARHGAVAYRDLLGRVLDEIRPERLVRTTGPAHLEVTVADGPGVRAVHLVSFLAARLGEVFSPVTRKTEGIDVVNDPFPLVGLSVDVAAPFAPAAVTLHPAGTPVPFSYHEGVVRLTIDVPQGHAVLILDLPGHLPT
jgi:Hypothetical glycosyl hydrolase 6